MTVPVNIAGQGLYSFIVDTSAERTVTRASWRTGSASIPAAPLWSTA